MADIPRVRSLLCGEELLALGAERASVTDAPKDDDAKDQGEHATQGVLKLPHWLAVVTRNILLVVAVMLVAAAIEHVTVAVSHDAIAAGAAFSRAEQDASRAISDVKPSAALSLYQQALAPPVSKYAPFGQQSPIELQLGIRLGHWASILFGLPSPFNLLSIFAPLIALVDVIWHLLSGGAFIARVMLLAQFVLGATLINVLMSLVRRGKPPPEDFSVWRMLIFCFGTVLFASGSAYVVGFVFTVANAVFASVSRIGGVSVTLGAIGAFCVPFLQRSIELSFHKHAERALENVL